MNKIVIACAGQRHELEAIRQWAGQGDSEVIAVALDFGDGGLVGVHDAARAAGATRCHVLDVREEFARDYMIPAIQANVLADEHDGHYRTLISALVDKKLREIGDLEGADPIVVASADDIISAARRRWQAVAPDRSAWLQIAFEQGLPVSINGVPMTLVEVLDCLSTIASAHGMPGARPEIAVLRAAHVDLAQRQAQAAGTARLELSGGVLRTRPHEYAATT